MACQKAKWLSKAKDFFAVAKESINNTFQENFKSPFSWKSILWDSYIADELPEKTMRFAKILTAISIALRLVNTTFLGIYLALDGLYSIYRHRFELNLTKSWEEDVPRFARIMLGLLIIFNFYTLF
ncbi:MAG: hypothetical protein QXJ06_02715 [Candidatus Aenigmatarchaeota archaeon]